MGGIASGADVRIAGLKVGSVTGLAIDPKSYQAVATFTVQPDIKLSADSSATIATGGLLGGNFISLATGGDDKMLADGGTITVTQSAVNLEDLLGKFIFNVGNLAEASQKQMDALKKAAAQWSVTDEVLWPGVDGAPVSCREKLRTLAENHDELRQVMQDTFEDALLMGVDEAAMRQILMQTVAQLRSPKRV